jgi:hypothetical protein
MAFLTICLLCGASIVLAQDMKPEEVYQKTIPSVATLTVEKADGSRAVGNAFAALKDGLAVTAWHVVKNARHVTAKFSDGQEFEVSGLVDKDEKRDIAIVKIKVFGRPVLALVAADPPVGGNAYIIGAPEGLEFSISEGLVSQIQSIDGVKYLQFTCAASHGSSGGPLVNAQGGVLGVVSWQLRDGQNLNFAIPISYVLGLDTTLPTQPWAEVKNDLAYADPLPVLPVRQFSKDFKVPSKPPFDIAPLDGFVALSVASDSFTVYEKGKVLPRVSEEGDLAPGRYFVSHLGVLQFDAAQKGKALTLRYEYQPHRIAVVADNLAGPIAAKKLQSWGDEPIFGPKVEAVAKEVTRGGMKLSDLTAELGCSRLMIVGSTYESEGTSYPRGWNIATRLTIRFEDLVTGQRVIDASGDKTNWCGFLGSPWRTKEGHVRDLLTALIGL